MGFAAFSIFFVITGVVAIQLIHMQPIPFDLVSFLFILWNFSVILSGHGIIVRIHLRLRHHGNRCGKQLSVMSMRIQH